MLRDFMCEPVPLQHVSLILLYNRAWTSEADAASGSPSQQPLGLVRTSLFFFLHNSIDVGFLGEV